MKPLDILTKVSTLIIAALMLFGVYTLMKIDKKATNFYEVDNKKINIKQVKEIVPKVDYIITYKEDKNVDIFRKYSTSLNPKEIQNIKQFLELAMASEFYNVEVASYMKFDKRTVELFHSEHYLKKVTNYSVNDELLSTLNSYGIDDFQYKNLEKLKNKVYEDRDTFLNEVTSYAKLRKDAWIERTITTIGLGDNGIKFMKNIDAKTQEQNLTQEGIEIIIDGLQDSYAQYVGIH